MTDDQLELCRQWFNSVQDLNPGHLETKDYQLAKLLYERLGMRVPSSIAERAQGVDIERDAYEAYQSRMGWAESDLADKCSEGAPRAGEYRNTRLQDDWEVWQACAYFKR